MICYPDELEPVDGWGWLIHWPCMEPETVVGDVTDSIRTHLCPAPSDIDGGPTPFLVSVAGGGQRTRTRRGQPLATPTDVRCISTGVTSRTNRLTGEATR